MEILVNLGRQKAIVGVIQPETCEEQIDIPGEVNQADRFLGGR